MNVVMFGEHGVTNNPLATLDNHKHNCWHQSKQFCCEKELAWRTASYSGLWDFHARNVREKKLVLVKFRIPVRRSRNGYLTVSNHDTSQTICTRTHWHNRTDKRRQYLRVKGGFNKIWSIIADALRMLRCLVEILPCSQPQVMPSQSIFCSGIQLLFPSLITKPELHKSPLIW